MMEHKLDGMTVIPGKAFLGDKTLRRIALPRTIREIGDWAFAHCTNLTEVRWNGDIPDEQEQTIRFGRGVFVDCRSLRLLYAKDDRESTAALLAAAVTSMNAEYLLDYDKAGSPAWLAAWDARMRTILRTPDQEGFADRLVCGEEDVGDSDQEAYESMRRCGKVRLLLLRRLYPDGLQEALRTEAEAYLREHTVGCLHDETWQIVLREHAEEPAWYRLFAELGCVTPANFDRILSEIGEEHPEMKAYFLRLRMDGTASRTDNPQVTDFFAGLEL